MSYPGDSSLASEIKERILSTFEQAIDLTESGSRKEALLGCDFVLRLDPLFEPARLLHKRLRADETQIQTVDLRAALTGAPLEDLGLDAMEKAAADLEVGPDLTPPLADGAGDSAATPETSGAEAEEGSFADRIEAELNASFDTLHFQEGSPEENFNQPDPEAHGTVAEVSAFKDALGTAQEEVPEPVDAGFDAPNFDSAPTESPAFDADAAPLDAHDFNSALDDAPLGAPAQLDPESERRIKELLDEGQQAFEGKEYQSAIDSWSRIFLIDIDHEEANQRIEDARRMASEAERQVEEVFHEAMSHLDEGDLENAREALSRVLEMQPTHLAALEYIERIDSGDAAMPPPIEVPSHLDDETGGAFDLEDSAEHSLDEEHEDLFTAPDIGPLAGADLEPATAPVVPTRQKRKRDPRRLFISVGSLVLVLVLLGGWFLSDNWSRFFPNSQSAQDVPAPPRIDPIRRAKALHEEGKTAIAISQLRRLPPGDPHYTEAQTLVAQWETAPVEAEPEGPTSGEMDRHRALLVKAEAAQAVGENLLVVDFLTRASSIAPLDDAALANLADAEARLAALRTEIEIFRSGDWEYALPALWRMREKDLSNPDVNRLIVDSYYNLGVRDLQRGRPESASKKFEEALNLRSNDQTLVRLRAFSETYQHRPEDLLYRIFVKYLPFR